MCKPTLQRQDLCGASRECHRSGRNSLIMVTALALSMLDSPICAMQQPQPAELKLLPGFAAELVYAVPNDYGSWVSLTTTPSGLIASDQYGKLYEIRPGRAGEETAVAPIDIKLGRAQGLLWAFGALYVVSHAGDGQPAGLYRVTDSDGDGELDAVALLRELNGGGEHGPHAVILGPDEKSLYICAGNHTELPEIQASRLPRNWDEDQLLRRMWDPGGHAVGIKAPGGWICKTDPDGKHMELISAGFRNQYDIAFNPQGELFTYDADMEWDVGTPWYRPTRVCHVTSGSEFGWRGGNGKWPTYYPDSVPASVEIGPGSPTGIVFGTGSQFPEKYQRALFIADWSYGFIYAVHLQPDGGTFTGEVELFCSAPALQVTDLVVDSKDGALYFVIGGRRTQSALYRIVAKEPTPPITEDTTAAPEEQSIRRQLEQWHGADISAPLDQVWQRLAHPDRSVRYAARIALEHQPVENWSDRALNLYHPQALLEAMTALSRCAPSDSQDQVIAALGKLSWDELSPQQRLHLLRNYGLAIVRLGEPSEAVLKTINERLSKHYPSQNELENRELCQLLIATAADDAVPRTLELLRGAPTQEEQIIYAMSLRVASEGWTNELRKSYLNWFAEAAAFQGGNSFSGFLKNARDEFIRSLSAVDKAELADVISLSLAEKDPYAELRVRPVIREWTVEELLPHAEDLQAGDVSNGERLFAIGQCFKCHRFAGAGGFVGPDLTGLSRRYTTQYLLEALIEPNKQISDQYQATVFQLDDGRLITGKVVNLNGNNYMVQTDMIAPSKLTQVDRRRVEESRPSEVSLMPANLLDSLTRQEILDLMAYLRSGPDGDREGGR